VDCEFTVQDDCLFLLQSRVGKRSARAAFRIAVDLVNEGMIDRGTARQRLTVEQFKVLRRPSIDPSFKTKPTHVGLPACPGIVSGVPVYSAEDAVNCKEPCILVSHETTPEDIKGMNAAIGILTQTGGATSHAAVVARAMDKTCVTGCTDLKIEAMKGVVKRVTINGDTGDIWFDVEVPVIDSSDAPELNTVIDWCLEVMGVCEATVTDIGMDKPHTIQAAQWWGNEDVLQAVLDGIAELPQRQHITLDLTPPSAFVSSADAELTDCFGVIYDDKKFAYRASQILVERASELKGLALRNFYGNIKLADLGYTVAGFGLQSVPTAVPADFAAYTVLARA
jgi:phosphohistidine swiveling domain-containing protein